MEPVSRPLPPRSLAERARDWIEWFGIARLVAASSATLIVCAGALWLLRTPAPATEVSLPRATAVAVASSSVPLPTSAATTTAPSRATVTVHVAGAVIEPGVYELVGVARVRDAIVAAGGPSAGADWNALNLAALLADGVRVYVPMLGEEVSPSLLSPPVAASTAPAGPINVNIAGAAELEALPGVGPATAAAIVTERERNGPFLNVDDLDRVPGIGPAKLEALRDQVVT